MSEVVVRDNWLPSGLLRSVAASWPDRSSTHWHSYGDRNSVKLASRSWGGIPEASRAALFELSKIDINEMLQIPDLFPDLDGLNGAGLHQMEAGGHLGLHVDAQSHPLKPWKRMASAVLYLDDCEGGELEFCDEHGAVKTSIAPKFNRLALFACEGNWHRVAPCQSLRRSLCLFFWAMTTEMARATKASFV